MKLIPTTAVALTLLTAAAPFAAFADDSGASVNVSGSALRDLIPSTISARVEANRSGSTTREHMNMNASSTMKMPHDGMGGNGTAARTRGDTEITARIDSLNKILARLGSAARLTSDAKASLTATINAEITSLTNLKAQIDTEATTTLKADDQSITKDFRIYALVMPQAAINAASDRVMTIVADMQALSAKIGTRITTAQTAGANVSAAVSAYADFDAKVADASAQAQAAVTEVANLKPDNGDATVMASNTAALKEAKTKIDAAQADLKAARADLDIILKAVKGKGEVKATVTASTTAQ